jgi:hypothetical protein
VEGQESDGIITYVNTLPNWEERGCTRAQTTSGGRRAQAVEARARLAGQNNAELIYQLHSWASGADISWSSEHHPIHDISDPYIRLDLLQ